MSKVLSDEVKEVIVKKMRTLKGIQCDVCGKVISVRTKEEIGWGRHPRYFSVTTGHNGWGNDSCESVEHKDICPECINKFVAEYLADEEYGSEYIEIETEHVYPMDVAE